MPRPANTDDFLPTRQSLLSRLRDVGDGRSWQEFFDTYGRLIHGFALRAGLREQEAKEMPEFRYDPARGSFKGWLRTLTRRRIADLQRRKYRDPILEKRLPDPTDGTALAERVPDPHGELADAAWDEEWHRHLLDRALHRVRGQVSARQLQIFELCVSQAWAADEVKKALGVNAAQIYLARHRVGKLVKRELERLQAELGE
jgi:RNA polymerase sigma-70 factor (ECF subfamily)